MHSAVGDKICRIEQSSAQTIRHYLYQQSEYFSVIYSTFFIATSFAYTCNALELSRWINYTGVKQNPKLIFNCEFISQN